MKRIEMIAAALLTVLPAAPTGAQEPFPSRMVNIINPNAPGGTSDIIGHGMTESLRQALKQPVIMTSRVGAGGAVGGAYVAQAPADGYTVLLNTVTHVLIPITDNMLGRSSGYSVQDFVMPARITADPMLFVVHQSIPAKTVTEFIAYAKSKPGEVIYSSTGLYGSAHIAMAMLTRAADVRLIHSPFNGAGPAMTAVLGNHANAFFAPAGVAIEIIDRHVDLGHRVPEPGILCALAQRRLPCPDHSGRRFHRQEKTGPQHEVHVVSRLLQRRRIRE